MQGWTPLHQVSLFASEIGYKRGDRRLAELVHYLVALGWPPDARLKIEVHINDKVYHRGVTARVVAASNGFPELAATIDQVMQGTLGSMGRYAVV